MEQIYEDDNVGLQVKAWLDKNGKSIFAIIAIAIAIVLGYQFYQNSKEKQLVAASMLYDEYQQALISEKEDALTASAALLREKYPQSAYATSVALLEASRAAFQERFADAQSELEWIEKNGQDYAKPLAALRLAQIKVSQQDYSGALSVLDAMPLQQNSPAGAFIAGFEELRGDIAAAQGDRAKAGEHYATALAAYQAQDFNNVLLQMKTETYR